MLFCGKSYWRFWDSRFCDDDTEDVYDDNSVMFPAIFVVDDVSNGKAIGFSVDLVVGNTYGIEIRILYIFLPVYSSSGVVAR